MSELEGPNPSDPNQGRSPVYRGPLVALAQGDFVYIHNAGDGTEELFNERTDPGEVNDLSRVENMQPMLQRFRANSRSAPNVPSAGQNQAARPESPPHRKYPDRCKTLP